MTENFDELTRDELISKLSQAEKEAELYSIGYNSIREQFRSQKPNVFRLGLILAEGFIREAQNDTAVAPSRPADFDERRREYDRWMN